MALGFNGTLRVIDILLEQIIAAYNFIVICDRGSFLSADKWCLHALYSKVEEILDKIAKIIFSFFLFNRVCAA
jgi:hypothetical protein